MCCITMIGFVKVLWILLIIHKGNGQRNDPSSSLQGACPFLVPGTGCDPNDIIVGLDGVSRIEAECPRLLPGEKVLVRCEGTGYGSQEITCLQDGVWSPSSVICLSNTQCERPETPQNGYIVNQQDRYNVLDPIEIRCNRGFDLIGSSSAYCRPNGKWSRNKPFCKASVDPESCDAPDVSRSVTVTPDRRTYTNETEVQFSCNGRNHGLLGSASSRCVNGRWSPDPGECYELSGAEVQFPSSNCRRRLVPDGVVYRPMQYSYQRGRSVVFSCASPDFSLVGQPVSTCGSRRQWDSTIPECVLKCPQPSPRTYTTLYPTDQVDYRNNDLIILECNGEAVSSKCINGSWTPDLEFCSQTRAIGRGITTTTAAASPTRTLSRQIDILLQEPVTSTSINRQLPIIISITNTPDERILAEDVHNVVTFLEKVANLNSTTPMVTDSMLEIVSNLMNVEEIELQEAQQDNNVTNRALAIITRQLNIVDVSSLNGGFFVAHQNLAVQVSSTTLSDTSPGSIFTIHRSTNVDEDGMFDQTITYGTMNGERSLDSHTLQAAISLPSLSNFYSKARLNASTTFRVSFVAYQKASLFISPSITLFNSREISFFRRPSTPIISATFHGLDDEIDDDDEEVVTTFDVEEEPDTVKSIECVYWDSNGNRRRGDWSSRGCRRVRGSPNTRPVCRCRRLANFAVLLDIYNENFLPLEFQYFSQILTYVGCGLSTCGLILTMIAYSSSSKLRSKQPNQILLCLITSLLGLYITFMLVISLAPAMAPVPCGILAALLHFFALSSLAWMGIEGVNVYLLFVRIINSYIPRFIRKAAFFGWGIPALVVIVIGCIFRENYARSDMCLIQQWPNITGLLIPVGLILLFNIVIFILVMKRISSTTAGKIQDNPSFRHRERVRRLRNAFILLLLLGVTWVFGFLVNIRNDIIIALSQVVFVLMNAFQGFFIFLIYCLRLPQVRAQLVNGCRYIYCPISTFSRSVSDQNQNANVSKDMKDSNEKVTNKQTLKSLKMDKVTKGDSFDTVTTP